MKRTEQIIIEILTKECERYHLDRMGFTDPQRLINDAQSLMSQLGEKGHTPLSLRKTDVIRNYYREKGFSKFCREHINDIRFENMIFSLMKVHLAHTKKMNELTDSDKYLSAENDSVSYGLSKKHFEEIYTLEMNPFITFGHPTELEQWCKEVISRHFPISQEAIISQMEQNDPFIWEKFYIKLRGICNAICYQMSKTTADNNTHDLWSDTCLTINKAVTTGIMSKPLTAKAIISYAVGIIKNKNKEKFRKRKNEPLPIDSLEYKIEDSKIENFFDNPITTIKNFPSHSFRFSNYIDISDESSVRGYFIVILYNKEHPLHKELISGLEDKIEKLFLHYIDELPYEQIVTRYYGEQKGLDLIRRTAQVRQEIKRVKETLLKRYYKLLKEKL